MSGNVLTYSPSDVTILISGYQLSGLLSVELIWDSRPFTMYKGIRNQHTRVFNASMCATMRLNVQQTSITNDVLSQIMEADRNSNSARLELTMKDTSGTTLYQALQCYIPAYPNIKFTKGFEAREWEINILDLTTVNIGGNSRATFDVFSSVQGALGFL